MLVSYNWIKEYLGDDAPAPTEAARLLGMHAFEIEEIEEKGDDTVIDVDVLPNRSSDCLSQRGIAREVATLTGQPLKNDPLREVPSLPITELISVEIADEAACPRFTASLIEGVEVKESPQWLKDRLQSLGQRPINNIVDATNYVMYAIGQPLHAYDAEKFPQVDGKWQFGVRRAKEGEVVSLIAEGGKDEDRNVECKGTELLIVDNSSDTPIGLAGVKGGRFAGVDASTTKIIIEAAHFDPTLTRQTARGLGIVIDASKRFENEPSRELPLYAQAEIIELITTIAGGESKGMIDVFLEPKLPPTVTVRPEKVNSLLGIELTTETMVSILLRAGIEVIEESGELKCTGPFERTDLSIEEDFIEEIGRIYGYDHVASVVPVAAPLQELNARHYYSEKVRHALLQAGFSEVITSSFRKKDQIQLYNALASDKGCLRSSLLKNLSEVLDKNASFTDLLGIDAVQVFEIGTVFEKVDGEVKEHVSLALGIRQKVSGYTPKDDAAVTAVVETLAEVLGVELPVVIEKGVGEINLTALLETLPAPTAYDGVGVGEEIVYQPFSPYPAISRDIAMWVPAAVTPAEVEAILRDAAGPLRVRTTHLDTFEKDGRTSLAFRLVFQADDRTLTDEEIAPVMEKVYKAAGTEGWETR